MSNELLGFTSKVQFLCLFLKSSSQKYSETFLLGCFMLFSCFISILKYYKKERGVNLRTKKMMSQSSSYLLLITLLVWCKLYCFAHYQAAPTNSSLRRHTVSPWEGLLKTDQWSSTKGLPRSNHSDLLTFVCLTPNYDVLKHKGLLMALHVLNICTASWSKGHLQ